MILPTKHLPTDRSLIAIGADIIKLLDRPKSVSALWSEFQELNSRKNRRPTFDWLMLGIAMLYALDAIEQRGHRIHRLEVPK